MAYFAEELGVKANIGSVSIEFFDNIVFNEVYIEDQHGDTLAYIQKVLADADELKFKQKIIKLGELELTDPHFHIEKGAEGKNNLQFVIDYFKKENIRNDDWNIECDKFLIHDGHFTFIDATGKLKGRDQVNFKNLDLEDIQLDISDLDLKGTLCELDINALSFNDHSGFELKSLKTHAQLDSVHFYFQDLELKTPYSDLLVNYSLNFNELKDYKEFENKVVQEITFSQSIIHLEDLNYFTGFFDHFSSPISLNGDVKGTVNELVFTKLDLEAGNYTSFSGSGKIKNVLNKEKMHLDIQARKVNGHYKDLEQIVLIPLNQQGKNIAIPENLKQMGRVSAHGNFIGTLNDLKANGGMASALGSLSGDMQILNFLSGKGLTYNGLIKTENFDLGPILEIDDLGIVNMEGRIEGSGTNLKNMESDLLVDIISIEYRDHKYENIAMNGNLAQNKFNGQFSIDQEDVKADFNGNLDFTTKTPLLDFEANIDRADLVSLNLMNSEKKAVVSSVIRADLVGLDVDNMLGSMEYDSLFFADEESIYEFGKGKVIFAEEDSVRNISINSDIVNAEISGYFKLKNIDNVSIAVLSHHLPSILRRTIEDNFEYTHINFDILLKDVSRLTDFLYPSIHLSNNTTLVGEFNNFQNKFDFVFKADSLRFNSIAMIGVYSEGVQNNYQGYFTGELDQINIGKRLAINDVWATNAAYRDTLESDLTWRSDEYDSNGSFSLLSYIQGWNKQDVLIRPSEINIGNDYFHIEKESMIHRDSTEVRIEELDLRDRGERVTLSGIISEDPNDELRLEVTDLNLNRLDPFLKDLVFDIDGTCNVDILLKDAYNDLFGIINGHIEGLTLGGEEMGDLTINSQWDRFNKLLDIEGDIVSNGKKEVTVKGDFQPFKENTLDLSLEFDEFDLTRLNAIPSKKVSEVSGTASGEVGVRGTIGKPLLKGELEFEKAGLKINYLNTKYRIGDKIRASNSRKLSNRLVIENDYFGFNQMPIQDQKADTGQVNASLFHENFRDWNFNASADFENFLLLETDQNLNPIYYGKANATGDINVDGYGKYVSITLNAETDPGTILNIPLGETKNSSIQNFVTFIDKDSATVIGEQKLDLTGVDLNLNMKISEDAEVQLIFDEKIGDVMKGKGTGDIQLTIAPGSDLSMVGRYVVKEGDYLFTLRNSLNKRFEVKPGGTITWFGDPYDAELDLEAIYKTRTSIYELVLEEPEKWKKRIQVYTTMGLTRSLLNPEIDFNISFPSLAASTRTTIENRINTEAERNKQVFGLLVLNKFFPPQDGLYTSATTGLGGLNVSSGAETNTYELLSNQLSNWLSKISNDFDIGLNYRPGDEISSEELAVALSTQLFDEKLLLYGNFGVSNGYDYDQKTTSIIGDFTLEYNFDKDGKFRLKVFNETNDYDLADTNQSATTQGLGLLYQEEFDTMGELFKSIGQLFKKDETP